MPSVNLRLTTRAHYVPATCERRIDFAIAPIRQLMTSRTHTRTDAYAHVSPTTIISTVIGSKHNVSI